MGIEQVITEELASASVTLCEISAITKVVNAEIKNESFITPFNTMIVEITKCYEVITTNLTPFCAIDSEQAFVEKFDTLNSAYRDCYLKEISKPRIYSDEAYEQYLVLQSMKECKTSFPLLKRTFTRLDEFVDKWITNDAWLAMGIDNLFKRLPRLFNEISELKQKDTSDAFVIYQSAFDEFKVYLDLISKKHKTLVTQSDDIAVAV